MTAGRIGGLGDGRPVLVVDDEDAVRTVVRRALARDGWAVEEATDGPSALELLRGASRSWAAVLLDLSLPGMNGQELFGMIQRERPELVGRLAFSSGAPSEFVDGSGRPLLVKPFQLDTLRELVHRLAEHEPAA